MITKDIEFNKEGITLNLNDGRSLKIGHEIAEKIWFAIEEGHIKEFVDLACENEYTEDQKALIRFYMIGRMQSLKNSLQEHALELALSDFIFGDEE